MNNKTTRNVLTRIRGRMLQLTAAGILVFVLAVLSTPGFAADEEFTKTSATAKMADGIELAADVYVPETGDKFPVILIRTAYGKEQMKVFAEFFAGAGYAVVVQDIRGKWSSEGEMIPFVHEQKDGVTTLDWIAEQPWCNGDVGMWGSSYLAYCAFVAAEARHPALKTVFANSGWLNGTKVNNPGGAMHWMLMLPWMIHEATLQKRELQDFDMDELFKFTPIKDVMKSIGIDDPMFENPDTLGAIKFNAARIDIPIFHMTGWNDFASVSSLDVYDSVSTAASSPQRLLVGPWAHDQLWSTFTEVGDEDYGPNAAMGLAQVNQLALKWFDRWLKGADGGDSIDSNGGDSGSGSGSDANAEEKLVKIFLMGKNEWREYNSWPPPDVLYKEWFLTSDGTANTLDGDGTLQENPPAKGTSNDTFEFDPMNPVPTTGGANFHFFPDNLGPKDQREVEKRNDVLVYTSAALDKGIEIVGPVSVTIYASTDGKDTDFTAKLVEVREDGYARNVVEGVIRAAYRNSLTKEDLLEPGEVYELEIDLGMTAIAVPKGSKLRLEISSSNFPKYDRNPNTGEHPWEAIEYRKAVQKVYHDSSYQSRLVIPVIKTKTN